MKKEVELCDICDKEVVATTHCNICGCTLCDMHDFGGNYSDITITIMVYNDSVFADKQSIKNICHVCHRCTDEFKKLRYKLPSDLITSIKKDFKKELKKLKKGN